MLERLRLFPVAAGVLHVRIEHRPEQVVADVVVLFAHLPGALARLAVEQPGIGNARDVAQAFRQPLIDAGLQNAGEQHVQPFALPPAVHIAFAETERAFLQNAFEQRRVVHPDIPGARAVDGDAGFRQHLLHNAIPAILLLGEFINTERIHNNPWPKCHFKKHSRK